nr:hypothetical protein [Tanacetum cinerariifolium]
AGYRAIIEPLPHNKVVVNDRAARVAAPGEQDAVECAGAGHAAVASIIERVVAGVAIVLVHQPDAVGWGRSQPTKIHNRVAGSSRAAAHVVVLRHHLRRLQCGGRSGRYFLEQQPGSLHPEWHQQRRYRGRLLRRVQRQYRPNRRQPGHEQQQHQLPADGPRRQPVGRCGRRSQCRLGNRQPGAGQQHRVVFGGGAKQRRHAIGPAVGRDKPRKWGRDRHHDY